MSNKKRLIRKLNLAWLLFVPFAGTALASSLTLFVPPAEGAAGSEIQIPINVRECQKLGALQLELVYDPHVLEPKTVGSGALATEAQLDFNVVSPGRLRVAMNTPASGSISGTGTLLAVRFLVRGKTGQESSLQLADVRAWDNTAPDAVPYPMLVTVESPAKFIVSGGLSVYFIAGIITAALALLGVVVAVVVKSKRKATINPAALPDSSAARSAPRFCRQCGQPISAGARFCASCGCAAG